MKMILSLCVFFAAATLIAQQAFILVPVKTDHPQDTMATYINAMDDYKNGVETGDKHLEKRIDDAIRCFDFDGTFSAVNPWSCRRSVLVSFSLKSIEYTARDRDSTNAVGCQFLEG